MIKSDSPDECYFRRIVILISKIVPSGAKVMGRLVAMESPDLIAWCRANSFEVCQKFAKKNDRA